MKGWIWTALFVVGAVLLLVCPLLVQNAHLAGDAQLKILRAMMPYWDRTESGGIVLLGKPADEQAPVTQRALIGLPADGSGDSRLSEEWQAALPSLIDKLDRFFENAHLEPGTYTFPNPYYPLIETGAFKAGSIPMTEDHLRGISHFSSDYILTVTTASAGRISEVLWSKCPARAGAAGQAGVGTGPLSPGSAAGRAI